MKDGAIAKEFVRREDLRDTDIIGYMILRRSAWKIWKRKHLA